MFKEVKIITWFNNLNDANLGDVLELAQEANQPGRIVSWIEPGVQDLPEAVVLVWEAIGEGDEPTEGHLAAAFATEWRTL